MEKQEVGWGDKSKFVVHWEQRHELKSEIKKNNWMGDRFHTLAERHESKC